MEYKVGSVVFEGWEITNLIGEGSYGKVFEIQKTSYGITTTSALKVITIPQSQADIKSAMSEGMDDQTITTYFKGYVDEIVKEILLMSTVKGHPNIVSYEDHQVIAHKDTIGWDILIRMELLIPLVDYQISHKLSEQDVIRLGIEISSALAYCHSKNLIHRDVKPENMFVSEIGQFKIGDFGVARTVERTTSGLSKKGTEIYMAPEVYLNRPYGKNVDVYSLGLVMYRMMNGNRLPFLPAAPAAVTFQDKENSLIRRMKGEELPSPIYAGNELGKIILKACAFAPEDRYKSAKEFQQLLEELSEKNTTQTDECDNDKTISLFFNAKKESDIHESQEVEGDVDPDQDIKTEAVEQVEVREEERNLEIRRIWEAALPRIKTSFVSCMYFGEQIPQKEYFKIQEKINKKSSITQYVTMKSAIGMLCDKSYIPLRINISGMIVTQSELMIGCAGRYGAFRVKYDEIKDIKYLESKKKLHQMKILLKSDEIILFSPDSGANDLFHLEELVGAIQEIMKLY